MARKALIAKATKKQNALKRAIELWKKPKHPTKVYNICKNCGRSRGYLWGFGLCRICFREKANKGELPGVRKSSW